MKNSLIEVPLNTIDVVLRTYFNYFSGGSGLNLSLMISPNNELQAVKEKFSGQEERIDKLFSDNETFRKLCFNYQLCLQNLERSGDEANELEAAIQQHEQLRLKLEEKLLHSLIQQELSDQEAGHKGI